MWVVAVAMTVFISSVVWVVFVLSLTCIPSGSQVTFSFTVCGGCGGRGSRGSRGSVGGVVFCGGLVFCEGTTSRP